ncbi:hypothetical protein [Succinimonas amylolytica]
MNCTERDQKKRRRPHKPLDDNSGCFLGGLLELILDIFTCFTSGD